MQRAATTATPSAATLPAAPARCVAVRVAMSKKPAAAFRGGLYDGLSSLTGVGQSSSTASAPAQSVTASPSQEAKPSPAAPAAGWSSDGVTSSFLNAINMRKKAAAHHAPGALKPKALTAPPKAAISTQAGAASSASMAVDNTPEEEVHDRYDPLKPNEFDHYVAQKNRRSEPVREDTARREEPPRKVQATGPVSIFAEKFVFPKKSPISQFPTPVLLLLNMAGAGNFDPQLEADTSSECSRFGRVVRCVVKVYPGAIEDEVTRIFVRFADVASAERAFKNLDGRFFDGRKVRAAYYDERAFDVEFA